MKPELKIVYIPHTDSMQASERYVFTQEELNNYISNVIKQTLDIAANNAEITATPYSRWCSECGTSEDQYVSSDSITNTYQKIFNKFKV